MRGKGLGGRRAAERCQGWALTPGTCSLFAFHPIRLSERKACVSRAAPAPHGKRECVPDSRVAVLPTVVT